MSIAYDTDTHEQNGRRYRVAFFFDDQMREPWKEHDGHGIVSDWTTRDKEPGERVLYEASDSYRYYDFDATVQLALKDKWGVGDGPREGETPEEYAARAVEYDYEYLRAWCTDEWHYVGVELTLLDDDGKTTKYKASLWGVETWKDYHRTVPAELADEIESQLREHAALQVRIDPDADVNWQNDAIQFPRLLAEIDAIGLTWKQRDSLRDAMDLSDDDLADVFRRASDCWEDIKAKTAKEPKA